MFIGVRSILDELSCIEKQVEVIANYLVEEPKVDKDEFGQSVLKIVLTCAAVLVHEKYEPIQAYDSLF